MAFIQFTISCVLGFVVPIMAEIAVQKNEPKWEQITIHELLPDHGTHDLTFTVNKSSPGDDVLGKGIMRIKVETSPTHPTLAPDGSVVVDDTIRRGGIYVFFEPTHGEEVVMMSYHDKNGNTDPSFAGVNTEKINIFQQGDKIRFEGCARKPFSSEIVHKSYYTGLKLTPRDPDPDEDIRRRIFKC